ncbi:geminin [Uranotaenia lowii]|uniref:geminin n=1 Tax=Uranotaenia lowii TaxID=190385 RepID=UPI002479E825|nr:geminin [Uranotaenia lowii]
MSGASGKIVVQVESSAEQEEHSRNSRKLLKDVQNVATMNKENVLKSVKLPAFLAHKEMVKKTIFTEAVDGVEQKRKKLVQSQSCQTSPEKRPSTSGSSNKKSTVTVEDLTSQEGPSEQYWEVLAEKRRQALEESLNENQELHEKLASMEEELNLSKEMLQEARNLVEVLTEMLQEGEAEKEETNQKHNNDLRQVDDSGVVPEVPSDAEEEV